MTLDNLLQLQDYANFLNSMKDPRKRRGYIDSFYVKIKDNLQDYNSKSHIQIKAILSFDPHYKHHIEKLFGKPPIKFSIPDKEIVLYNQLSQY